jgi:zinc protease
MKRAIFLSLLLSLFLSMDAVAAESKLKLPQYKKVKLQNGMTVLLMEQHEVPIINFDLKIRAGTISDPAGREGLASLTADLLRKGTTRRTADQIAAELDFVGGSLDFGSSYDYAVGEAEFLKKDIALGLDLLSDLLINPTFPQSEFDKLQKQRIDAIKDAKDSASEVINTYFRAFLYSNHPYARPTIGDERSLAAVKRDDVVKFYQAHYAPSNVILAVVGDFSTEEMERQLREKFGSWKKETASNSIKLAEPKPFTGKKLLLVDKPDSTQTFFVIGNVGISRTNPDRVGIGLVNTLFGGRFTSMLNSELRINSGLTYGARSSFSRQLVPGPFVISTYTANPSTEKALDMALDILKRLHDQGITEDQLKSAKTYIKGQYSTTIETPEQLASLLTELEFYGLDESEINDFFTRIDAFTVADARRVIKQYFPLENLVFVLIGKGDEVGNVVKKYAPKFETRQITQPGFYN